MDGMGGEKIRGKGGEGKRGGSVVGYKDTQNRPCRLPHPGRSVKNSDQRVCMSVCLSARSPASKTTIQISCITC